MRKRSLLSIAVLFLGWVGIAPAGLLDLPGNQSNILPVNEAFVVHEPVWTDGELVIGWDIAPGCYLYRDRISLQAVAPDGISLGDPVMPKGEIHHDEHFGDTEIYRDRVQIRVRPETERVPKRLQLRFQGCLEDTVCYPPQTVELEVMR